MDPLLDFCSKSGVEDTRDGGGRVKFIGGRGGDGEGERAVRGELGVTKNSAVASGVLKIHGVRIGVGTIQTGVGDPSQVGEGRLMEFLESKTVLEVLFPERLLSGVILLSNLSLGFVISIIGSTDIVEVTTNNRSVVPVSCNKVLKTTNMAKPMSFVPGVNVY